MNLNNIFSGSLQRIRPNARQVTTLLLSTSASIQTNLSSMLMQFGQFLSHDITKNKLSGTCDCSGGQECVVVELHNSDKKYDFKIDNLMSTNGS